MRRARIAAAGLALLLAGCEEENPFDTVNYGLKVHDDQVVWTVEVINVGDRERPAIVYLETDEDTWCPVSVYLRPGDRRRLQHVCEGLPVRPDRIRVIAEPLENAEPLLRASAELAD